jgi:hypothetical protein
MKSKYPPAKPGALRLLASQRGLIAIGKNQNQTLISEPMVSDFVAVIPAKAGIQCLSGFRVAFHLPGMTILLPKMSNSGSPPAKPGVYLTAIKTRALEKTSKVGEVEPSHPDYSEHAPDSSRLDV